MGSDQEGLISRHTLSTAICELCKCSMKETILLSKWLAATAYMGFGSLVLFSVFQHKDNSAMSRGVMGFERLLTAISPSVTSGIRLRKNTTAREKTKIAIARYTHWTFLSACTSSRVSLKKAYEPSTGPTIVPIAWKD